MADHGFSFEATLAHKLTWIGVQLEILNEAIVAEVTEAKAGEISQLLTEALTHNLVSVTCLRTIIGKCILSHRSSSFGGRSSNDCAQRCTQGAFRKLGPVVVITWDASPFGMGATLQIQGQFREFFAVRVSPAEQDILGVQAGDCQGQQVWEALAGLIALRQWAVPWQHTPVFLRI